MARPTDSPTSEDYDLLHAWRDGDRGAGNRLVRRHFAAVHRFFASKLDQDVDELIQRTFEACLKAADRFWPTASMRAFLLEIARRQLLKYLSQRRRDGRTTELSEVPMASLEPTASRRLANRQGERLLLHALRRLPLDHQITIELYYWEELRVADIARVLGVQAGTIKSRLHRSRAQLREQLLELEQSDRVWRTTVDSLSGWAGDLRALAQIGGG